MVSSNKVALCLAGGGATGILQVAMLKAWTDLGLTYSALLGTSVGAINGLFFHSGDLEELIKFWMTIKNSDVYNFNIFKLGRALRKGSPSLYDSSPLLKTLNKHVNFEGLYNNQSKFYVTATDYFSQNRVTKEYRELAKEELVKFVYASASPPIVFPPVEFRGMILIDGGLTSNYNIEEALNLDVDTIVVLAPSTKPSAKYLNNIADVAKGVISIAIQNQLDEEMSCVQKISDLIQDFDVGSNKNYKSVNLIVVSPDEQLGFDLLDFSFKGQDRQKLFDYGYELAKKTLTENLI